MNNHPEKALEEAHKEAIEGNPEEDLQSRKHAEQPDEGNPKTTTLTLSAGLKDAEIDNVVPAHAKEEHPLPDVQLTSSEVEEMDDHSLLAATRTGDEIAFQELVRRYRNQITNYVYRILDDYDRAVDLAQETFLRVYMHADRYQATYSFSTYIYRIAYNLAISELRQRKRRRLVPLPTFFSDKDSNEIEVDLPDQQLVQADDAMIGDERRDAVAKAIVSLPEKYRMPLILCDLEERSYEEISEVLNLPVGTVKSRINRARNLLKDKLRDFL